MASGKIVFRAQTAGATRAARDLSRAARRMRTEMVREFKANAPELVIPFQDFAPFDSDERDSYHMQDHITAQVSSAGRVVATVKVEAISPESGFDYLDVTRFGHRGGIHPLSGTRLKWTDGAGTHYARSTAGSHPGSDWVEDARPFGDELAGEMADRIGRVVLTRIL